MRLLWTLVKVALALVLVVPVCIIVLATLLGIFGAVLGLAILALKLAALALLAWGAFRLVANLMRGHSSPSRLTEIPAAPTVDPYYEAAMRELDRDIGVVK
jgi:hypothetical protein